MLFPLWPLGGFPCPPVFSMLNSCPAGLQNPGSIWRLPNGFGCDFHRAPHSVSGNAEIISRSKKSELRAQNTGMPSMGNCVKSPPAWYPRPGGLCVKAQWFVHHEPDTRRKTGAGRKKGFMGFYHARMALLLQTWACPHAVSF